MKRRIELIHPAGSQVRIATLAGLSGVGGVKTVDEKPGTISWVDRAKAYWKLAIAVVGALLVMTNELTPLLGQDKWFNVAVSVLTAVSVYLKSNEIWVQAAAS